MRYRGLAKNANGSFVMPSSTNLYLARARLTGQVHPDGANVS